MPRSISPNVVFILTDDQGPWAAGCCGNEELRTPNLDRLAGGGMLFTNFFCTSPVCSPARASLMTGRIPSQHGVHDWIAARNMPPDAAQYLRGFTCYSDILADNGYACALSGKWHLGDSMTGQHGFSRWFTMPRGGSKYNDAEMIRDGKVQTCPGYLTDVITDEALAFLEQSGKRPFYLSVHYNAPHSPWTGHPPDIVASYDDCPFETCPQEPAHPWGRQFMRHHLGNRDSLKGYFAAITAMDLNVGRILDKLEDLGLRENTLVVFTSDNGYSCGHHGFWGKGNGTYPLNMYENSIKVPAVFSHPGRIPAGVKSDALVSQYDFMPTLLEYLGIAAMKDETLPGQSFGAVLTGRADEARDRVVVYDEYGPVRMIRTREWKYVQRWPDGPDELYDLVRDGDERRNLADEKSCRPLVAELQKQLTEWFARYVDPARDGRRLPVTGLGQIDLVDPAHDGSNSFHQSPA